MHLPGGFEHRGYWLDAHSGLPGEQSLALAERVLPRLPTLRAVLFEVTGPAVPYVDPRDVRELLVRVREQWRPTDGPLLTAPPIVNGLGAREGEGGRGRVGEDEGPEE
ncbi:hypothetical protein ACFYUY_24040 [Kitasatospora sp. NPDC004745]|uniref:hypothetical protein n=1 Tax=Kitasatospora sp. NPDC004745 TaxID=3364019 RepID=UPI00367CBE2D